MRRGRGWNIPIYNVPKLPGGEGMEVDGQIYIHSKLILVIHIPTLNVRFIFLYSLSIPIPNPIIHISYTEYS